MAPRKQAPSKPLPSKPAQPPDPGQTKAKQKPKFAKTKKAISFPENEFSKPRPAFPHPEKQNQRILFLIQQPRKQDYPF